LFLSPQTHPSHIQTKNRFCALLPSNLASSVVATTGHCNYRNIVSSLEYSNSPYLRFFRSLRLVNKGSPENLQTFSQANLSGLSAHRGSFQEQAPYIATAVTGAMAYAAQPNVSDIAFSTPVLSQDIKIEKNTRAADLIFGSVAGITGKVVEYPFDTIKVRLQTQPLNGHSIYNGSIDCIRQSLQSEGLKGLYRGISAPLVGSMFENAVLFVTYNYIQSLIRTFNPEKDPKSPLSIAQLSAAGFMSGAAVSFVLTPVELVKCRLQADPVTYSGPWSVVRTTLRTEGIKGMFRGHAGTVLR